ncbi:hypothetical protein V8G54_035437 [Vigna mungo]|uniref:Uncharacterized protein n=1 Tax=Vigna mungo TaxID=3915 RepID=A0AAQ3REF4_VIGMU
MVLNHFDSPKDFEGIQMPGSAPSALRSPFDIPYDPFEEKPNLTGDGFDQELKNLLTEPRQQEEHEAKEHTLLTEPHPIDQRLQGTGDNNPFEQLSSEEASESESKAFVPLSKENGKCETEKTVDINGKEVENAETTIDDNRAQLLEKVEEPTVVVKPQEDEENAADVSSMSSDIPDDTPTFSMTNDQHNIFGVKDFVMEPSHSSVVAARWKRLMRLMDNRANHSSHSEKPREVFNISENSSKAQVTNDGNSSTTSEQDNTHNSQGNEALNSDVQQEITDEVSINSNSSSSGAEP